MCLLWLFRNGGKVSFGTYCRQGISCHKSPLAGVAVAALGGSNYVTQKPGYLKSCTGLLFWRNFGMPELFRHTVPGLISLASECCLLSHKPLFFAFCTQYTLFLISHDGVFDGNSHHSCLPNQARSHRDGLLQHERTVRQIWVSRYWPSYRRSVWRNLSHSQSGMEDS